MEDSPIYQSDNIPRIIAFLQQSGLLNRSFNCHKCKTPMQIKDREAGDKKTWRCPKYSCQTFLSVRTGSWFSSNRIRFNKILKLIFSFVSGNTVSRTAITLGICRSTVQDHFQMFRYYIFYIIDLYMFLHFI